MNQNNLFRLLTIVVALLTAASAGAIDLSHYTGQSVLASGKWVKIAVSDDGVYRIPAATLRNWGFSDPNSVRIYGYGGRRIADALTADNFIDDLPMVSSIVNSDGSVAFYARGPHEWEGSEPAVRRSNPYSVAGYYFVTANDSVVPTVVPTATPGASAPATSFIDRLHHEQELTSPGEGGQLLVGEDFRYTPSRTFTFNLPDICGPVTFRTSFVAKTTGSSSRLDFKANGKAVESNQTDVIAVTPSSGEAYGIEGRSTHTLTSDIGERLELTVTHSSTVSVQAAWLNYISVNYERKLSIPAAGYLTFTSAARQLSLANASEKTVIWDVTDPAAIKSVNFSLDGGSAIWTVTDAGQRDYVAWTDASRLPTPEYSGSVANQNHHADEEADMVIFTHPSWASQAERLAELHRGLPDTLKVNVVDASEIYNEFSSGSADVSGLRKYLKMLYDRGAASGRPLKYALLMGRMTYDERQLTAGVRQLGAQTMPAWQQREDRLSLTAEQGFCTDDFLAMLTDGSGTRLGADNLSIGVGRLPVTSVTGAKTVVDKIVDYSRRATPGVWKNRVLILADDGDDGNGVHYKQSEWFARGFDKNAYNPYLLEKIYLPAYEKSNGIYQTARDEMYRLLNDGVAWWTFVGHANNHSWTGDGMLTYTDINNNMYFRHIPFVYAATCNFLRWDSNEQSGGEIMMFEKNGGVVGMISATRPVYIVYNGYFTNAIGKEISARDSRGRLLPTGEIYRRAKNNIRSINSNDVEEGILNNDNRLRYVFMGDPAVRLSTPDNIIIVDTVNGKPVDGPDQIVLPAWGMPVIKGSVCDPAGNLLETFNGTLVIDLYDADQSVTIPANEYPDVKPFDRHGSKLYSGSCKVIDGRFSLTVAMPADISENFREASILLAAYTDDNTVEAAGLDRSCYVYGFDETAAEDTEPPVIEFIGVNHPTFRDGDEVNSSPLIIATVNDNVGINLSMAGIGHQMSIMLDDKRSYNDVPFYFTPASDGSPAGDIAYPLEGLTDGHHTVRLRVFDTSGNSASKTIDFFVRDGMAPTIFDLYADASPATTEANFYLSHNRPESMLTVTVSVYNLLGHKLWEQTSTGRSDMYTSPPVTWDLTDGTGRRVPRGIYLYRATVTSDGETYSTASRKIAVTAR